MSIYLCVCLRDNLWTFANQLTDNIEIRYLGSSANIQVLLFLIF